MRCQNAWRVIAPPRPVTNKRIRRAACRAAPSAPSSIAFHGFDRFLAQRHEPLLRALAQHAHHARLQVDLEELHRDQLGDAQPGRVQRFEHRPVAQAERRRGVRRSEQRLDVGLRRASSESAARAWADRA